MIIKFIVTIFILINLKLPIVNLLDIGFISLLILLLITTKVNYSIKELFFIKKLSFFIILLITIINILIPKLSIEEAHSIFVNNNDINVISKFLPKKILTEIHKSYDDFDLERIIKSDGGNYFGTVEKFKKLKTIDSPFAFSSDSFFQNQKYSRQVNKINFSSRENLRIGQLNTLTYNFVFDKNFRRILPYYVAFEIPDLAKNSSICSKGNLFYHFSKYKEPKDVFANLDFKKNTNNNCIEYKKEFQKLYIIGYSINEKDDLSIKFQKNNYLIIAELIKYISIIIILLIFAFSLGKIQLKENFHVYSISVFSTAFLALIRDSNLLTGLRYFRGGADGLWHYSSGRDIIQYLSKGQYFLALKGGEDVFYFMPGLRYFNSINNVFFGDTNFGYLILATLLPLVIFKLFKKYINKKIAYLLFISFIFLPVFENMGFGYFNYIWQIARNHAETLSITLIIIGLSLIIDIENEKINLKYTKIFFPIFLFSIAVLARPNFFPTAIIFTLYVILISYFRKNYFNIFVALFAFSFIFLCFVHNIYFGNNFSLFTKANVHFAFTDIYRDLNLADGTNIVFEQLKKWNPLYNIHRLFILAIIIYCIICYQHNLFTYALFLSAIFQHSVLFLTHPDSRYAYLAWLLTFILFIKIEFSNKILQKLFFKLIKK
jgi:hypothetical protein